MEKIIDALKPLLWGHIVDIYEQLDDFLMKNGFNIKLVKEVGVLPSIGLGDIFGRIGYKPHSIPEEEMIDETIDITIYSKEIKFIAEIDWADGEVIAELREEILPYSSLDNSIIDEIDKKIISIKDILVIRMKEVIIANNNKPPRYPIN